MLGIDKLARLIHQMDQKIDHLAREMGEMRDSLGCLERTVKTIASQLEEMDAKLTVIADTETVLGTSIQTVIEFFKNNPNPTPTDLTAQLGVLDVISQRLIDTNASTLANLPPTPEPVPVPEPAPGRRH
jgi:prefoldin subunit 5